MTAELVNLRRARKARVRAAETVEAAANRARHGRTLGQKAADAADAARRDALLAGAKRGD